MNRLNRLMTAAIIGTLPLQTVAFEINPNHEPGPLSRSLKGVYKNYLAHLTMPTHEELSRLSLACAENKKKVAWCDLEASDLSGARPYDEATVVLGSRWNDDPNNFFRVGQERTWLFWLKAADYSSKPIKTTDPLEYRSHYGDLQFLHSMGSKSVNPVTTQGNVIGWAQFAYDVASGQIPPTATMKSLEQNYPFTRSFAGTSKREWTVKKLFTNIGDIKCRECEDLPATNDEVAALALGALLHTIQDSFSSSHVERSLDEGESKYRVVAWLDYRMQKSGCHGTADKDVGWISDEELAQKPAISWGAWVVRNAMMQVPWQGAVESQLRSRMFGMSAPYKSSYGGKYTRCPAA